MCADAYSDLSGCSMYALGLGSHCMRPHTGVDFDDNSEMFVKMYRLQPCIVSFRKNSLSYIRGPHVLFM